ncbi:ribose-phosphate pyrophosphokinase [Podospora fimiseda]|uniref:ribose-phosphate diphosphokinase n=1 Tax=Podospora fimiseda TaxID=252190 RepID=A0AAN7H5F3_9PEZI|nr:ribose-phosphate pyrophosphokinase [Podospora fimiseda]
MVRNITILPGSSLTSNPQFISSLVSLLGFNSSASRILGKFSSGESRCEIIDSIRGKDVFIIQTFGCHDDSGNTVNDYLMELCIMISACKGGSAKRVVVVLPVFPYGMQGNDNNNNNKRGGGGEKGEWCGKDGYKTWVFAQSGRLIADLLTCAGADRILTCDLHESTYQGFFDVPVDNLFARGLLKRYIEYEVLPGEKEVVIVSPDAGGAKRASVIADGLGLGFALIHKERETKMMLVGDVRGKLCVLVDDLADTGRTIIRAARLCKKEGGAKRVIALLTHGIFSGDAIERINGAVDLDQVVVTNTVGQGKHCEMCPKLKVLDMSPMFAEAIRRVHHGESISVLFQFDT